MHTDKIDWDKLSHERSEIITTLRKKQLPSDVFVCPFCQGSGRVTIVYREPCPNRMGTCRTCDGVGEIIKCISPDCEEPVPNEPNWYANKLCEKHEKEYIDNPSGKLK